MRPLVMVVTACWSFGEKLFGKTPAVAEENRPPFTIGDVVFIQVGNYVFRKVSETSDSWVNHVGVIVGHNGTDYIVAESTVPLSRETTLQAFIARSMGRRYAVRRLPQPLTEAQQAALCEQAKRRMGIFYHTGFKLASKRQYCSKLVYEVYRDALDIKIGEIETFTELLHKNPNTGLVFWRMWFGGLIPWSRTTVTPASEYISPALETVYESPTAVAGVEPQHAA